MADLTADAPLRFWGEVYTRKVHCNSSTSYTWYKGQPALIDQNVDTLYATPFVDSVTVASTDVCLGVAAEGKTVTSGASETDGDSYLEIYVAPTRVGFKSAVFTNADLGKTVYKSDSDVLSTTSTANAQLGKLFAVEDGYAYVELTTPQVCASA